MQDACNFAVGLALVHLRAKEAQWSQRGISVMPLDLWTPNKDRFLPDPCDRLPKVIDFFHEITEEEFEQQYLEFLHFIGLPEYSKECRDIPLDRIIGTKEANIIKLRKQDKILIPIKWYSGSFFLHFFLIE